jgi:CubicO group peptidase (beta-lactamase class C family)
MLPTVTTNLAGKIDKLVASYRHRHHVPAVVIGLVGVGDTVPAVKGYGSLNPNGGPVPTGTSIFEIGSVTKTFTAAALAWLVNEQRIAALSDPAQTYVPGSSGGGVTIPVWQGTVPVTLLDLADFAPGFPPDSDKKDRIPSTLDYQGLFCFINNHPDLLVSQPGKEYAYADAAFELLGAILAHVQSSGNGYDYNALLRAMIAAGEWDMPDTVVQMSTSQRARLVPGYSNGKIIPYAPGDWLIVSTMNDMLVWLHFQMGLLSGPLDVLLPMIRTKRQSTKSGANTGLGLFFRSDAGRPGFTKYWKNGVAEGYSSYITFSVGPDASEQVGVAVFANERDSKPGVLGNAIFNLLSGSTWQDDDEGAPTQVEDDA